MGDKAYIIEECWLEGSDEYSFRHEIILVCSDAETAEKECQKLINEKMTRLKKCLPNYYKVELEKTDSVEFKRPEIKVYICDGEDEQLSDTYFFDVLEIDYVKKSKV